MRARVVAALLVAATGCSLFVDTGDLNEGSQPGALANDASTSNDARVTTTGDASGTHDSGADVTSVAPPLPRILADWPVDEGTGTSLNDVSGRGHHGLFLGAGGAWVSDHAGTATSAYDLTTADDHAKIPGSPDFDRPSNARFSMTVWARTSESPDHDMFFSVSYGDDDQSFGVELVDATTLAYFDGKDHVPQATVPNVVGAWHHYAVVVDGSEARIYFDGVRIGQASPDRTPRTAKEVLLGRSTWGDHFKGAIDKARFFSVALTDAEVLAEKTR